jgi:hypothetical protein
MPPQRMTAKKTRISDIMNGNWVKREGLEPSFVITPSGEKVSRARLLGTVVARFLAEDGNFGSITLDDGTDTIRAKTFKTVKPLDEFNPGETVDLVGKVREYNGEIYVIPEVIARVSDPNFELMRRLELLAKGGAPVGPAPKEEGESAPAKEEDPELRKEVLAIIGSEADGIDYSEIMKKVDAPEERVESVLNEVLAEGICYEPTPGRIKKI